MHIPRSSERGRTWIGSLLVCFALAACAPLGSARAPAAERPGPSQDTVEVAQAATDPEPGAAAPLRLVRKRLVESDSAESLYSLVLADEGDREISAYLRRPNAASGPLPGVVLVAGRYAGREAARLIPRPLASTVLAVEYPADIPDRIRLHRALVDLPEMRATARRMPGMLVGAARYAAGLPGVDSSRIGLVGVSFGVPFAAIAGKDPVFSAVVLAYGGAGISDMLTANLPIDPRIVRSAMARLAGWYFRDLEPDRHVGGIAPTPLLLVNGIYDSHIPHGSAVRLASGAAGPVEHVWLPSGHIGESKSDVIREVATIATDFFDDVWTRGAPPRIGRIVHAGAGPGPGR